MRSSISFSSRTISIFSILVVAAAISSCKKTGGDVSTGAVSFRADKTVREEWLGAYFEGKKIGYVHSLTEEGRRGEARATRVSGTAFVEMSLEGERSETRLDQTGFLDEKGDLLAFEYRQEIMGHTMAVRGERLKDELVVEVDAGGGKRRHTFPFESDLTTSGLLKDTLLKRPLKPGEERVIPVLLEPLLAVETVTVRVLSAEKGFVAGRETEIYTIEENFKGITGTVKVTREGITLQEDSPHGFKLIAEEKESALKKGAPLSIVDLLLASRVETSAPIPSPRQTRELKVRLLGLPTNFPLIEDERQKITATESASAGTAYSLLLSKREPAEKGPDLPVAAGGFEIYLGSDYIINADNPEIAAKAREIVGSEKSALAASRKLYDWVNTKIGKKLVDTVSAVDTLKTGAGECQAHSNLFAALARSAGIPTKVISGIVYSEDFEGFMYHAWNEVWLGEWVAVDATLGGFPADAARIKLSEGGLADQLKILSLVGKIRIEVDTEK